MGSGLEGLPIQESCPTPPGLLGGGDPSAPSAPPAPMASTTVPAKPRIAAKWREDVSWGRNIGRYIGASIIFEY